MERSALVRAVHDNPAMAVLAVTGGGITLLADLLSMPGASRTVLEAVVPYSDGALAAWLGAPPGQAVSATTARAMAEVALSRAEVLTASGSGPAGGRLIGLAVTAALVSDRPKRGEHRAHVAAVDDHGRWHTASVVLDKGGRDRPGEDRVVADLALSVLARACGLDVELRRGLGPADVLDA